MLFSSPMYFDFSFSPKVTIKLIISLPFSIFISSYAFALTWVNTCFRLLPCFTSWPSFAHICEVYPSLAFASHFTLYLLLHVAFTCTHFSYNKALKTLSHFWNQQFSFTHIPMRFTITHSHFTSLHLPYSHFHTISFCTPLHMHMFSL